MLDYVVKLTCDPGGMTADDAQALRTAGFDDTAILDICQVASYYNYVNRLADGLGVQLEERWRDEDCTLTRDEFVAIRDLRRGGASLADPPALADDRSAPDDPALADTPAIPDSPAAPDDPPP